MDNRLRRFRYFDWFSCIITFAIALIGLMLIFSATFTYEEPFSFFFTKQAYGILFGIVIYCAAASIDYRTSMRWGAVCYLVVLTFLAITLVKGSIGMGGQRWLSLFFFKIQPSELAKLFFPAFLAHHFEQHKTTAHNTRTFIPLLITLGVSCILIAKQPDLGTALLLLFSGALLMWHAGMNSNIFKYTLLICALCTPILWKLLKPYQKKRIEVFLGQGDSHKERYQIEQATIAIGSGGFLGKGFLRGTQNKLRFLPESRTDMIFAVLCEEFGFVGALALLLAYLFLVLRILGFIAQITPLHVQLYALGLLSHVIFAVLINVAMVTNLLPVVGIPLPMISYGLSNLWVTLASFGILQAITMYERQ